MFAPAYASGGSQSFQIKKDQFKYFVIERQNEKEVAYGKSKIIRQNQGRSAVFSLNVNKVARIFHGNLNFDSYIFNFQKVEHYLMV